MATTDVKAPRKYCQWIEADAAKREIGLYFKDSELRASTPTLEPWLKAADE